MNKWTKKSIEIANSAGYLDRLSNIYQMQVNPERPLSEEVKVEIKQAFDRKDTQKLIRLLLDSEVFPVKDSYVGFLRRKPEAIEENPKTTKRIGARLYALGWKSFLREASRPKETNRQLGPSFRNWLASLAESSKFTLLDRDSFKDFATKDKIAILKGGDKTLKRFAEEVLGENLNKGIDLVIKKNAKYFLGEAKFLTTPGGEQDRGFDDAYSFVSGEKGKKNVNRIALIDGYVWLEAKSGLHQRILENDVPIFSALLLRDFLDSI